jgi:hypothetical protein
VVDWGVAVGRVKAWGVAADRVIGTDALRFAPRMLRGLRCAALGDELL